VVVGDGGRVCGVESWLERDHVMPLDFDAAVVGSRRSVLAVLG